MHSTDAGTLQYNLHHSIQQTQLCFIYIYPTLFLAQFTIYIVRSGAVANRGPTTHSIYLTIGHLNQHLIKLSYY